MTPTKKLILIVEDNEAESYALARTLRRGGYHAFECRSIAEAKKAMSTKPDLILIDIQLPDGSGIDFSALLLESEDKSPRPAIILISAHDLTSVDHLRLLYSGAGAFLPKPIAPETLLDLVRQQLSALGAETAIQTN